MSEDLLRSKVSRGHHAKRIMEDELVVEAFDLIERQVIEAWQNSRADEEDERRNAYLMQRLLKNLRGHFQKTIRDGESASKELLRLRDPSAIERAFRK